MTRPRDEEIPHLAAIERSRQAGFRFLRLPDNAGNDAVIHAGRQLGAVVERYTIQDMTRAIAARFRVEDYPTGDPVWQEHGTVHDVITALLDLPPHGTPGAPVLTRRTSSSLWLPPGCR